MRVGTGPCSVKEMVPQWCIHTAAERGVPWDKPDSLQVADTEAGATEMTVAGSSKRGTQLLPSVP